VYGDAGSYGGLAGFSGPALGSATAPVVRYQDLMRTSAPASAGVPEFGRIVQDEPQGFGAEPLPMPTEQMMLGSYGAPMAFKDTDGRYEYTIDPSTDPYAVVITKAPSGTVPRSVTPESNKTAYDSIVTQAKKYNPYWFANSPTTTGTEQKTEREAAVEAEKAEAEKKGKKKSALEEIAIGAAKRAGFITSGKEEEPKKEVSKDDDQTGTDWGKIVLIGGGVLVGITSIVLITRALTSKE
jgi:hypothetical protein